MIAEQPQLADKGYRQLTDTEMATAYLVSTVPIPARAMYAELSAEAQAVRWRADGTDPTTTVGNLIPAGGTYFYTGPLDKLKVIRVAAGAKLNIQFWGTL